VKRLIWVLGFCLLLSGCAVSDPVPNDSYQGGGSDEVKFATHLQKVSVYWSTKELGQIVAVGQAVCSLNDQGEEQDDLVQEVIIGQNVPDRDAARMVSIALSDLCE